MFLLFEHFVEHTKLVITVDVPNIRIFEKLNLKPYFFNQATFHYNYIIV